VERSGQRVGKRIRVGNKDDWREIVGAVGNVYDDGVNEEAIGSVYWPLMMGPFEGDTHFAMRQAVWSVNPNLPLAAVHTQEYFCKKSMARTSFTLIMLGAAGSMAPLLGVVGIYGVIAYSV
jgi:hypothetical protein